MKSASKINYEIRPCKYIERKMLVKTLARIVNRFDPNGNDYQYIGLGGLSFTDFKLMHKELNITKMTSIEGAPYNIKKLDFNKPFSCIDVKLGDTSVIIPGLSYDKKTIAWLDYDGTLDNYMFTDAENLIGLMPVNSIYIVSCNYLLNTSDSASATYYTNEEFQEKFGDLVPSDVPDNCCTLSNAPDTLYKMFNRICVKKVRERNFENGTNLKFQPLYFFIYQDGGAPMFTFGGIILESETELEELHVNDFDFINPTVPYKIDMPVLTFYELNKLNQAVGDKKAEKKMEKDGILQRGEIEKFKKFYKYMPNFFDVRL